MVNVDGARGLAAAALLHYVAIGHNHPDWPAKQVPAVAARTLMSIGLGRAVHDILPQVIRSRCPVLSGSTSRTVARQQTWLARPTQPGSRKRRTVRRQQNRWGHRGRFPATGLGHSFYVCPLFPPWLMFTTSLTMASSANRTLLSMAAPSAQTPPHNVVGRCPRYTELFAKSGYFYPSSMKLTKLPNVCLGEFCTVNALAM